MGNSRIASLHPGGIMKIADFLSADNVLADMRVSDKDQLLRDLAGRAASILDLPVEQIASALLKREELGSTGMGGGVAMPHARIQGVTKPLGMMAQLRSPIDFGAIDGEEVDLVFAVFLPSTTDADQLVALACVARKLRKRECISRMRQARTAAEIYAAAVA
jgi:PTS system nitrogen regulatory IIA component